MAGGWVSANDVLEHQSREETNEAAAARRRDDEVGLCPIEGCSKQLRHRGRHLGQGVDPRAVRTDPPVIDTSGLVRIAPLPDPVPVPELEQAQAVVVLDVTGHVLYASPRVRVVVLAA